MPLPTICYNDPIIIVIIFNFYFNFSYLIKTFIFSDFLYNFSFLIIKMIIYLDMFYKFFFMIMFFDKVNFNLQNYF